MVANALVSTRLDNCNSLFHSLSCKIITSIPNMQSCLAAFFPGASRFTHFTTTLKFLHTLKQRIILKTLGVIYKYFTTFKLKVLPCFSRFLFTAPQFINLKFIAISVSRMMLQNSEMICTANSN